MVCPHDFSVFDFINAGSFSEVFAVKFKLTNKLYAMKLIDKGKVFKHKLQSLLFTEREILKLQHPFLPKFYYAFQTSNKLGFIMSLASQQDLRQRIQTQKSLPLPTVQFYAAEICLALDFLHSSGVIHRDLKPSNILLDTHGHIQVTDFGLSKLGAKPGELYSKLCGAMAYRAPEMIHNRAYSFEIDYWALGLIIHEMLSGQHPILTSHGQKCRMTANEATNNKSMLLSETVTGCSRQIVEGFLVGNPTKRLGANGINEIKVHRFFSETNWEKLAEKEAEPPFKPTVFEEQWSRLDKQHVPTIKCIKASLMNTEEWGSLQGFEYVNQQASLF